MNLKIKNDDIKLESSQRLIELLSNIEHSIAYALLNKIRYKEYGRISYLDFGNDNDNVSYIINNKFFEILESDNETWREKVWTDKRTNLKIGKFIKMMFGDNFPVNQPKNEPTPKPRVDIESFVNMFKAEREKNINYSRFEIVKGEDIRKWYKQDNYSRFSNDETPLGKSCMRYKESSKFLKMYSTNTDIFSMLILKDDAGKLKGRALVWNLESPKDRVFMDRIYTVNDYDIEVFKNYAKENGWLYRVEQRFGWFNKIADPTNNSIFESQDLLLQVTLSKCPEIDYNYYPYLDTLSIYNTDTHVLSNNGKLRLKNGHILLTDYQGSYHCEVDERPRVYSSIYNGDILEEYAVYLDIDETYCERGDEVTVSNTNGKLAYRNSPKIVCSCIRGSKTKYFLKEVCVYSDYLNTHIYVNSAVNAFLDDKNRTPVVIHKNLIGVEFEEKDGIIIYSQELVTKNKENEIKKQKCDYIPTRVVVNSEPVDIQDTYTFIYEHMRESVDTSVDLSNETSDRVSGGELDHPSDDSPNLDVTINERPNIVSETEDIPSVEDTRPYNGGLEETLNYSTIDSPTISSRISNIHYGSDTSNDGFYGSIRDLYTSLLDETQPQTNDIANERETLRNIGERLRTIEEQIRSI